MKLTKAKLLDDLGIDKPITNVQGELIDQAVHLSDACAAAAKDGSSHYAKLAKELRLILKLLGLTDFKSKKSSGNLKDKTKPKRNADTRSSKNQSTTLTV